MTGHRQAILPVPSKPMSPSLTPWFDIRWRAPKTQPAQCPASQQRVCRSAWPAATVPLASWDGSTSGLDGARVCCMNRCRPSEVGWCGGAFPVTVWVSAVPFNVNAERRHHIPSQRHRATNSAAFDAARCAGPQDPDPQHREAGHSSSAARLRSRAPAGGQVLAQVAHRRDTDIGQIAAAALTTSDVDDASPG